RGGLAVALLGALAFFSLFGPLGVAGDLLLALGDEVGVRLPRRKLFGRRRVVVEQAEGVLAGVLSARAVAAERGIGGVHQVHGDAVRVLAAALALGDQPGAVGGDAGVVVIAPHALGVVEGVLVRGETADGLLGEGCCHGILAR